MTDHEKVEEPADPPRPPPPMTPADTPQEPPKKRRRISVFFAVSFSILVTIVVLLASAALGFERGAVGAPLAGVAFWGSLLVIYLISLSRRRKNEAEQESGDLGIFSAEEYEELQHFVGPGADDYYLPRWKTGKTGFTGAGCVLSVFWLVYRKMYKPVCIIFGIFILFDIAVELSGVGGSNFRGDQAIGLLLALVIGCYGSSWYLSRARKVIHKARTEAAEAGEFRRDVFLEKISRRGGVSWFQPFVWMFFYVVFLFIILPVFAPEDWGGRVVRKQNDSVYYTNEATEADARKVMKALTELEFFGQGGAADVRVDVTPGGRYSVSFVVREGIWKKTEYVEGFQEVGEYISQDLGRPLRIDLCNDSFKVQKSIQIEYKK